jgi:hypothetical protein
VTVQVDKMSVTSLRQLLDCCENRFSTMAARASWDVRPWTIWVSPWESSKQPVVLSETVALHGTPPKSLSLHMGQLWMNFLAIVRYSMTRGKQWPVLKDYAMSDFKETVSPDIIFSFWVSGTKSTLCAWLLKVTTKFQHVFIKILSDSAHFIINS